ncbi:glycosyltransferase [Enterococcus faecium]|uniref:glycosyltransferase n=2 Tax=Enterococcus faecium TaxID=1352 RepID=UPI000CF2F64B|nr:glycosyltransferase [Enterococcus faecium]MBD9697698.1 glycosyltransferase [Enterococcus faecium]PQE78703.1 glycosyltransferase [Enterococcus faecium]PQF78625.1 glycosyltransferase [Enterococcus faecium]PQG94030.1 glycosyltransferase [Enterococcus faecium]RBS34713.1 hypothetical protein EB14_00571 [Enterococcus faecium]
MRVVVNDIAASEGGAMSVLKDFYEEVREFGADHEWIFLLGDYYLEETPNIKVYVYPEIKKSWLKRLNFDFYFGKKIINEFNPDIYLSLQNTATLGVKATQIVYLHQCLPYQKERNFSLFKKEEYKYAIYQRYIGTIYNFLFRVTAANIIVQTKWMKSTLQSKLSNSIYQIYPNLIIENNKDFKLATKPIKFFYPAADLLYKNHEIIFEAVNKLVKKNVGDFKVYLTINKKEIKNEEFYCFLGNIPQEEVFSYYQNSVLLFPSYIETYGLPLKEAQFFGTPILASKTDFSKEVLTGYSKKKFFHKYSSDELSILMKELINKQEDYRLANQSNNEKKIASGSLVELIISLKNMS